MKNTMSQRPVTDAGKCKVCEREVFCGSCIGQYIRQHTASSFTLKTLLHPLHLPRLYLLICSLFFIWRVSCNFSSLTHLCFHFSIFSSRKRPFAWNYLHAYFSMVVFIMQIVYILALFHSVLYQNHFPFANSFHF